ncbi:MAG: polysaccharide deacetylase family protein [Candidatus Devosia euplotis]|nr:polysaccharide deacetylase family protein [Candidatus Devosia euplotis]
MRPLERLAAPGKSRAFVVLTFDGGYKDNLKHALPILRRHEVPFTLYVPTALVDGVGELWWQAIEDIIARQQAIALMLSSETDYVDTLTTRQKQAAFDTLYWQMRKCPRISA